MNERASLARRVGEAARAEGVRGLWFRSLSATAYRRLVIASRDIGEPSPAPQGEMELDFTSLDRAGVGDYLRMRGDQTAEVVEARLGRGERCALVLNQGAVISARWFTTGFAEMDYLGLRFELPARVAYVYDVYTAPAAREHRISARAKGAYEDELRREGTQRLLGTFMPENTAGLALVTGAGYHTVGSVGCVRLPGIRIPVRRLPPGYLGRSERIRRRG